MIPGSHWCRLQANRVQAKSSQFTASGAFPDHQHWISHEAGSSSSDFYPALKPTQYIFGWFRGWPVFFICLVSWVTLIAVFKSALPGFSQIYQWIGKWHSESASRWWYELIHKCLLNYQFLFWINISPWSRNWRCWWELPRWVRWSAFSFLCPDSFAPRYQYWADLISISNKWTQSSVWHHLSISETEYWWHGNIGNRAGAETFFASGCKHDHFCW